MKKFKMNGFGPVFRYTLKNQLKTKKFIISTIILGIVLFAGITIALVLLSKPDDEEHEFKTTEVYVCDETGMGVPDYKAIATAMNNEDVKYVNFKTAEDSKKTAEEHKDDKDSFLMVVQKEEDDNFLLEMVSNDAQDDKDVEILEDFLKIAFQDHVYANSGLTQEELVTALMPVMSSVKKIDGKEENEGKEMVTMLSLFICIMLVYFMVIFYGQAVCTEVSLEKTSKLVEQLLTRISPNALVTGKILAAITASFVQVGIWALCIIAGVKGSNVIVGMLYDGKKSVVGEYLSTLGDWFGSQAFSVGAVILTVAVLLAGLMFYLILAGFAGSMVTKPEEAPNMQVIFMIPMMISFFIVLFGVMKNTGSISLAYNLIPFTSAMTAPASVLIGKLSIGMGLLSLGVTALISALLLWLAAKIYRGLMFFSGNKLGLKTVWGIIKGK